MQPDFNIESGAVDAFFFTPNPCIERTLRVPNFARGNSHRVFAENLRVTAGGKGINAARVAQSFGAHVRVLAPVGSEQIVQFRALLAADHLQHDLIETSAATRIATNIVHQGGFTELVEAGNPLSARDGAALTERFTAQLSTCQMAIIGGSYPPFADSVDGDVDAENHSAILCEMAACAGKPILYDGKGAPFARALRSAHPPWAIKPNLAEASELLSRELETPAAQRNAARELVQMGVEVVLLSCGARGLWLGYDGQIEWLPAPQIEEVSPVGSGDSLVGAFVARYLGDGDIFRAARWGAAAGAANAAQLQAARIGPRDAELLLKCDD